MRLSEIQLRYAFQFTRCESKACLAILECVFWKLPLLTSVTSTKGCSPKIMMYKITPALTPKDECCYTDFQIM